MEEAQITKEKSQKLSNCFRVIYLPFENMCHCLYNKNLLLLSFFSILFFFFVNDDTFSNNGLYFIVGKCLTYIHERKRGIKEKNV
jgi:hypothetical protein